MFACTCVCLHMVSWLYVHHRGVQMFFGGCVVLMTIWVWFFVPETKGVPLEQIDSLFAKHWFWKRYLGDYHIMDTADTELVGEVRLVA